MLYHRGWYRAVESARSGLNASLLVQHPETKKLFVNFDPQLIELIHEARCLRKLNLEIPELAQQLLISEQHIKDVRIRFVVLDFLLFYSHELVF
jgi:dynein heavy chain